MGKPKKKVQEEEVEIPSQDAPIDKEYIEMIAEATKITEPLIHGIPIQEITTPQLIMEIASRQVDRIKQNKIHRLLKMKLR